MLVVGLLVGMSATAGGRVQGLANGLQLLYILPSFPPYDLDALPARLLGLSLGVTLLVVADVLVLPQHGAPGYERRLADAVLPLVDYLGAVRGRICDPRPNGPLPSDEVRSRAAAAVADLATERLPVSRRPTGPSAYDHALRAAAMLLRVVHSRVVGMDTLIRRSGTLPVEPAAAALVDDVVVQLVACQSVLDALAAGRRGAAVEAVVTMPPDLPGLGRAFATYEKQRLAAVESVLHMEVASETQLRFDSMTSELAEATASLVRATRSAALLPEQPQPTVLGAVPQFVAQTRSAWAQWLSQPRHPPAPALGHPAELGPARARPVGRPARGGCAGPLARLLGAARDPHPAADDDVRDPRRPAAGAGGDSGRCRPGRPAAGAVRGAHRRLRPAAAGGDGGGAGGDPARAPGGRAGVLHAGGGRPCSASSPRRTGSWPSHASSTSWWAR